MWVKHEFLTIFTSNDVVIIQYRIGKGFGSIEISLSMEVNDYFGPMQHLTMDQ